jgi:hypothetical protein
MKTLPIESDCIVRNGIRNQEFHPEFVLSGHFDFEAVRPNEIRFQRFFTH